MRFLVPLALFLSFALMAGCSSSDGGNGDELTLGQWAAGYCRVLNDVESQLAGTDDRDPSSLTVEERKLRYQHNRDVVVTAYRDGATSMDELDGPGDADAVAAAWIRLARGVAELYDSQNDAMQAAASAEDIEALNAEFGVALREMQYTWAADVEDAPQDVTTALNSVTRCGD